MAAPAKPNIVYILADDLGDERADRCDARPRGDRPRTSRQRQSYDIIWIAPRFEGEKLVIPAKVTVLHNGVCVQAGAEPFGPTGHRNVQFYKAHPAKAPIRFQDHKDLPSVKFRNIWVREPKSAE